MTSTSDQPADEQLLRAKNAVRRKVSDTLDGSGLEIRELNAGLVISNPRDPEKGQIHVSYADWYVSWERTAWDYWGHLAGFDDRTADQGAQVNAERIINTLAPRQM